MSSLSRRIQRLALLAFILLFWPLLARAAAVEPTAAEQAWLTQHPVLRIGVVRQDWAPIDQIAADGSYQGISAELIARIAEQAGLRYEIRLQPDLPALLGKLRSGEIDLAPSMARTAAREAYLLFTQPYLETPVVMIARRDANSIGPASGLKGRIVAVEHGYPVEEALPKLYPGATPLVLPSTLDALRAVADGRADAYIGALAPASYAVERNLLANLAVRGPVPLDNGLRLAMRRDAQALAGLLDRAIASIDANEREAALRRWMPVPLQLARAPLPLSLEPAQRAWLAQHRQLKVGYIRDAGPLVERGSDGRMHGLFADEMEILAQRLGIALEPQAFTLGELVAAVGSREVDLALGLSYSPERERSMRFVGPLLATATVAVTRIDADFFRDPAQYNGQTVALKRGHFLAVRLARSYPGIRLLEFDRFGQALDAVARGEAVAAFNDLTAAGPLLAGQYAGVLKLAGVWNDAPSELHLAVRKDQPELAGLLRIALDSLTESELHRLRESWLAPRYDFVMPWRRILLYGIPVLLLGLGLLGLMLFWNRRLRAEVVRRERAEIALVEARDRALAAADNKAAFLAAVSHEIRTPMNGVIGLVDSLGHSRLDENQRYQLGVVARSARMALEVLNDALDYARVEAGRLALDVRPSDLQMLAEDVASMFAPLAAERGLVFQLSVSPQLPWLQVDPLRLRQIMANFVSNAIRYTEHGFVRLNVAGSAQSTRRWKLVVEVQDSGRGIADSERARVFQPFESLGGPGAPGTGLGLTVCRALAEAMGGQIELDSAPGRGSRFRFTVEVDARAEVEQVKPLQGIRVRTLIGDTFWRTECSGWLRAWGAQLLDAASSEPAQVTLSDGAATRNDPATVLLVREAGAALARDRKGRLRLGAQPLLPSRLRHAIERALVAPAAAPAPVAAKTAERPRRVLVVDDEPLNLRVACQLLALLGFEGTAVNESQAGFEAFSSEVFAAVLLDYRMPGEDGISLATRMRARERSRNLPATPIVAVTADGSDGTASACQAAGMDTVMLKPLTLESLFEVLDRLGCAPATPPELQIAEADTDAGDASALLEHLSGLVGSLERARDIADGFVIASLEDMVELREKLEAQDLEGTRFIAHRIKGGARNAGFLRVGDAAAELERAARDNDAEASRRATVALTRALDRLREQLQTVA